MKLIIALVLVLMFIYFQYKHGSNKSVESVEPFDSGFIDKKIFDIKTNTPIALYDVDPRGNTKSNQNLRALVRDMLDDRYLCNNKHKPIPKTYINWVFNHSRFTNNKNKRYWIFNQKKYFNIPLESYEYETPLLDALDKSSPISKNDIIDLNHLDIPKTTNSMCTSQIFTTNPNLKPYTKIQLIIVTDPVPAFAYSRIENSSPRIHHKISELAKLMIIEHNQESTIDKFENTVRAHNITLYQIFEIDIVVHESEPYVSNIHTNISNIDPEFIQIARKILNIPIKKIEIKTA